VEVSLQILVFDEKICNIPSDQNNLNSILIVHLTSGRDYFIVIDAIYQRKSLEADTQDLIVFD
jgi:hypothetical protein